MTARVATALRLPPEAIPEYTRRHEQMDDDIRRSILDNGARSLSIFAAREFGVVVMVVELDDVDAWTAAAETELTRRWWAYMSQIMPTNDDLSPIATELPLLFHLEDSR